MVESQLENCEEEFAGMYNTSQSTAEESGSIDHEDNSADKDSNEDMEAEASMLWQFRFDIAYKRQSALYDHEGALQLKSAMMQHMFKKKFGANAISTAYDMVASYNPLSLQSQSLRIK